MDLADQAVACDWSQEALDDDHDEERGEVPAPEVLELAHHAEAEREGGSGTEGGPELDEKEPEGGWGVAGEDEVGDDAQEGHHDDRVEDETLHHQHQGPTEAGPDLTLSVGLEDDEPDRVEDHERDRGHQVEEGDVGVVVPHNRLQERQAHGKIVSLSGEHRPHRPLGHLPGYESLGGDRQQEYQQLRGCYTQEEGEVDCGEVEGGQGDEDEGREGELANEDVETPGLPLPDDVEGAGEPSQLDSDEDLDYGGQQVVESHGVLLQCSKELRVKYWWDHFIT